MRLNQNCIRDILLELEDTLDYDDHINLSTMSTFTSWKKYGEKDFLYTISKLSEAKYINESHQSADGIMYYELFIFSLTWNGHKFLDTIRDNEVWSTTKSILAKFSSVSITTIENVASNVLTNLISKQMNL